MALESLISKIRSTVERVCDERSESHEGLTVTTLELHGSGFWHRFRRLKRTSAVGDGSRFNAFRLVDLLFAVSHLFELVFGGGDVPGVPVYRGTGWREF